MVIRPSLGYRDDVVDLPVVLRFEVQPAPGAFALTSLPITTLIRTALPDLYQFSRVSSSI